MTDRINIAELRKQAETAEPNTCPADELAALLDVAEAAHRLSRYIPDDIYYTRDHDRALMAFNAYLACFDFGDTATEGDDR